MEKRSEERVSSALARSARAHGAGTRQQVRAAARRFVRRHRRDASYLSWGCCAAWHRPPRSRSRCSDSPPRRRAPKSFRSGADGSRQPVQWPSTGVYSFSAPAFGDLDGDGDLDLFVGQYAGFAYFRNIGSATNPAFVLQTGAANPLASEMPTYASPAIGDFDRNGDVDVYAGAAGGRFNHYARILSVGGSLTHVSFPGNPLANTDLGSDSAPAAADLDRDGDLDLVTGNLAGTFAVHYFPEPARGLLLGAGVALLGWLGRVRRRD